MLLNSEEKLSLIFSEKKKFRMLYLLQFWITLQRLTFATLCANSEDGKLLLFFLFFPENRIWHFMQIVSIWEI